MKSLLLAFLGLAALARCGRVGLIDGNYAFTGWTCGSTDLLGTISPGAVTAIRFQIADQSGTYETTFATSSPCTRTQPATLSYGASSVTIVKDTPSCTSTCTLECIDPQTGTSSFSFSLDGNTLTLTRTLTQADIDANDTFGTGSLNCTAGEVETRTMTK